MGAGKSAELGATAVPAVLFVNCGLHVQRLPRCSAPESIAKIIFKRFQASREQFKAIETTMAAGTFGCKPIGHRCWPGISYHQVV